MEGSRVGASRSDEESRHGNETWSGEARGGTLSMRGWEETDR